MPAWPTPSRRATSYQAFVRVVDGDTGKRLPEAQVRVGGERAVTASDGFAVVPLERAGKLRIRASAPGYRPYAGRLPVRHSRTLELVLYRPDLQWPIFGATAARTQAHPAIRLRPPFKVVWQRGLKGLLEFPAVVSNGVAYANNYHGVLYALSMRDGAVLWTTRVGTKMASSPAVDPKRGVAVTTSISPGYANVVDLRTGKVRWRYYTGKSEGSPVIRDGVAYFGSESGRLHALDLDRRRPRWVASLGAKITSNPALVGNRLYFGDYAGRVFALDARTGRRIWTRSVGTRVYGTVAVAEGKVFVPSVFSGLFALSASSGRVLWRRPLPENHGAPAYYRGRVFFGTKAGTVYSFAARNGRTLWARGGVGNVASAPQVVAGVVYAAGTASRIYAYDWRSGRILWTFRYSQYAPVSGNGGRLLMHGYARIYAVEPRRK